MPSSLKAENRAPDASAPTAPAARGMYADKRVLVVACFDSFLRSAAFYAQHFERGGATIQYTLLFARKNQLSLAQAQAAGLHQVPEVLNAKQTLERLIAGDFEIALLALDGARVRRLMIAIAQKLEQQKTRKRPLILTMYPGILFRFHLEGMLCRMSSDLFLLNSPHDFALYERARKGLGLRADNAIMAGLSVVPPFPQEFRPVEPTGPIVFVAQPTVPAWGHERLYLVDRLAALADRCKRRTVIIKPRHRKTETTLHEEHDHFEDMLADLAKIRALPQNLVVSYEPLRELLISAGACLTVSSTAAIEALALGVPTRIITDFGIHEHLGNHFFLESGLLCALDDVQEDSDYVLEPAFRRAHAASAQDHLPDLDARMAELLAEREKVAQLPLPDHRLFGRPPGYDAFVLKHFSSDHLSLLAERKLSKKARFRHFIGRMLKALGLAR